MSEPKATLDQGYCGKCGTWRPDLILLRRQHVCMACAHADVGYWRERARAAEGERDAAIAVGRVSVSSLRNVRMLAAKIQRLGARASAHLPQDTIADHLLRYCDDAGVTSSVLRGDDE